MILGFKTHFPRGKETKFVEKILANIQKSDIAPKKHTIRKGNRWKVGDTIHMATGVRTKKYKQFNKGLEGLEKVVSIQEIEINHRGGPAWFEVVIDGKIFGQLHSGYCKDMNKRGLKKLAINDGFDTIEEFLEWFDDIKIFKGQIIHFTDLRY